MARSLWPREHGAYAQLAAPIVTALVIHVPRTASVLLAIAACFAFLANEPLLVVLGHRGARMLEAQGGQAKRRLALLATLAIGCGGVGLVLASHEARLVAAAVAVPALAMVALAWTRSEHSLAGELVAALTLPGASAPVAVASGVGWHHAMWLWAAWALGYAGSVIAVHRVIARHRKPATWRDGVAAAIVGAMLVTSIVVRPLLVALPLCAAAIVLIARPPRASYLRTIGVALVVASVASGALAIL